MDYFCLFNDGQVKLFLNTIGQSWQLVEDWSERFQQLPRHEDGSRDCQPPDHTGEFWVLGLKVAISFYRTDSNATADERQLNAMESNLC